MDVTLELDKFFNFLSVQNLNRKGKDELLGTISYFLKAFAQFCRYWPNQPGFLAGRFHALKSRISNKIYSEP